MKNTNRPAPASPASAARPDSRIRHFKGRGPKER
jgi:hypothetical protein